MPNNNELLEAIIAQNRDSAKKQLTFAADMSIFINEQKKVNFSQSVVNAELKGYLETNSKTNQKGIVETVRENSQDISAIRTEKKIDKAKQTFLGVIVGAVLAFLGKILF